MKTITTKPGSVTEAILKLHKQGLTNKEIATALGKRYQHVYNTLTRYEIAANVAPVAEAPKAQGVIEIPERRGTKNR